MKNLPEIKSIDFNELNTSLKPEQLYNSYAGVPYSALLCGKGNQDNGNYSFIGVNPFHIHIAKKDPFNELQELIEFYSVKDYKYPLNLWGGIGYISYSAAHFTENLPKSTIDSYEMPVMQMVFYKDFFVFDNLKNKKYHIKIELKNKESLIEDYKLYNSFDTEKKSQKSNPFKINSNIDCCPKFIYLEKVGRILDYIKKGDVYEVNLSQQCSVSFEGDTYALFKKLLNINPSPFSAYLPFGDVIIMSNSPERFLFVDKDKVETRPIKGTFPRGINEKNDRKNRINLINSKKDDAELSMIVDLLRNDLGKVSKYGSVKVREHKRIEKFSNVWQMLSIIESKLKSGENYGSLLRACFPGGSITGCPKIRSMQIIDELEKFTRNIYTGTIFIANDLRLDSNIVIRTLVANKNKLYFNVGGAVVYDSSPENEYEETIHKAKSILRALKSEI